MDSYAPLLAAGLFCFSLFYRDRKSTRLNSSHTVISYAVFCLKKTKLPITSLTTPMLLLTLGVLHETIGIFVCAVIVILATSITVNYAYDAVAWPTLGMLSECI